MLKQYEEYLYSEGEIKSVRGARDTARLNSG